MYKHKPAYSKRAFLNASDKTSLDSYALGVNIISYDNAPLRFKDVTEMLDQDSKKTKEVKKETKKKLEILNDVEVELAFASHNTTNFYFELIRQGKINQKDLKVFKAMVKSMNELDAVVDTSLKTYEKKVVPKKAVKKVTKK